MKIPYANLLIITVDKLERDSLQNVRVTIPFITIKREVNYE